MGLPMPGHRVEVIDEAGNALPPGEVGDIALHGAPPSLFVEYWKDDEATRAVIARAQTDGTCWMGETTWRGKVAMRLSVSNWSTTRADIDRSVDAILAGF